jgi:ElaB/YqjD/DUF883 family membrane-anchored ribosome-binding protein
VLYKQQFNHWRFHQSARLERAMQALEDEAKETKAKSETVVDHTDDNVEQQQTN